MKTIANVKRIFLHEDFDELVLLLKQIKEDTHQQVLSCDKQGFAHGENLQIIAHRLYTHPQNPTLNVLEVDYVNKVDASSTSSEDCDKDSVPCTEENCES